MTPVRLEAQQHILLIGLPGSGKSTVGPLVANLLKMPFIDVDREIERVAGVSIETLFRERGEAYFRNLESEAVVAQLDRPTPAVVATGGGWAAQARNLSQRLERRVCVYLETSPPVATARASQDGGRPLLPRGQELLAMEQLLRNRERYYAGADLRVTTDGLSAREVARRVAELARMNSPL